MVEFGQFQSDLVGAVVTDDNKICGKFGIAEIYENYHDKLILFNTSTQALTLVNKIYRGIIVKNNKKKEAKINP